MTATQNIGTAHFNSFPRPASCTSTTCYAQYVTLADEGRGFEGYAEWARTARNTCKVGQAYGKELCGDLDRQFGINSRRL